MLVDLLRQTVKMTLADALARNRPPVTAKTTPIPPTSSNDICRICFHVFHDARILSVSACLST
jgi:hypothetical protein